MANIGYVRVSSAEQNNARQLDTVQLDKTFEDQVSGSSVKRPGLITCLDYLREGDVLHVHSIDRLARNLVELQALVTGLTERGVTVHFHTENIIFGSGEPSALTTLLFQCLGAFAQFERAMIKERQSEGIASAKAAGKHLGRPAKLSAQERRDILSKLEAGEAPSLLAKAYCVSKSTVHNIKRGMHSSPRSTM